MIPAITKYSFYPIKVLTVPIDWLAQKVANLAQKFFGYILRIITFQIGVIRSSLSFAIMRLYQQFTCDPKDKKTFDPKRLEKSKKILMQFGGQEVILKPKDGAATIRAMTFQARDFFKAFEDRGATLIECIYEGKLRKAFSNPPREAAKFYFPLIEVKKLDQTIEKCALLPASLPLENPPWIFYCHSPGRSMCMDRRFLGLHLAAGYNVMIWDPRGTAESTGRPSEGGYYLDAEVCLEHLLQKGILPRQIYVAGYCKGAAIAAHLKRKYHAQGIHFIASNPYTSMKEVVASYGFLGRVAAYFGLREIQDPSLKIPQDFFDNVRKLKNLPRSQGKCIFIHTDTDTMMPPQTVARLRKSFGEAGPVFEILRKHPNPKENGHMQAPFEDPKVWRQYIQYVS